MTSRTGINWDEVPLGRVGDDELAHRYGVSRQAVQKQRRARGIPAWVDSLPRARTVGLTRMEREDRVALEEAVKALVDGTRRDLATTTATTIGRLAGWHVEARTSLRPLGGSPLAYRFRAPGRRKFTEWLRPARARLFILEAGWVDAAGARLAELAAREQPAPLQQEKTDAA